MIHALLRAMAIASLTLTVSPRALGQAAPDDVFARAQRSLVKIYGAGGMQGLEAYQSGVLVSGDGRVVTTDSLVLEQGEVTAVLSTGERYSARVLGADPLLRVALLQFDPAGETLEPIDLADAVEPRPGEPLLAFSNMFNIASGREECSVMRTHLAAVVPRELAFGPTAARGADRVLLVDSVTSNPGAAGGLLTDYQGRPVGLIGNETQGRVTGGWLNHAIPASQVAASVQRIEQGEQLRAADERVDAAEVRTLDAWGFALVASVASRTPPYIEFVRPGSAAARAGLLTDDLLVMVDGLVTATTDETLRVLSLRAGKDSMTLTVERRGELVEMDLPGAQPGVGKEAPR